MNKVRGNNVRAKKCKAGERLVIISENMQKGKVVEPCWKYSINLGTFYKLKEFYVTYGFDKLKSRYMRMKHRFMKMNATLVEKVPENAQLSESTLKQLNKFIVKEDCIESSGTFTIEFGLTIFLLS